MHEIFMEAALKEAYIAYKKNEVPVGAVVTKDSTIIGKGHNLRNSNKNPLHHGEMIAINEAAKNIGDWRLEDCTIYVTVEPCAMCAGAIVLARIKRLVFGARNKKAGCCGSILNITHDSRFNHQVDVMEGILAEQCAQVMSDFFAELRLKKQC